MIDKKRLFKSLIIISLLIIIIIAVIQIRRTLARYETIAETERTVDAAFWIIDGSFEEQRLLIENIFPSNTPFEYRFAVSNFNQTKIAETDMEYEMVITTTTNLPLSYEILKESTTIYKIDSYTENKEEIFKDADGTYYREIKLGSSEAPFIINTIDDTTKQKSAKTDNYKIKVTFDQTFSANENYADLMEDIKIQLIARQRIGE